MKKFIAGALLGMAGMASLSAYATIRRLHKNGQTYSEWVEANADYLASGHRRNARNSKRDGAAGMATDAMRQMP